MLLERLELRVLKPDMLGLLGYGPENVNVHTKAPLYFQSSGVIPDVFTVSACKRYELHRGDFKRVAVKDDVRWFIGNISGKYRP